MAKCKIAKKFIVLISILSLTLSILGCSKNENNLENTTKDEKVEESNFKTVGFLYENEGREYNIKVDSPRQRAVTLSQFMTEMLLALGLEEKMVGTALLDNPIPEEFKQSYEKIPKLEITESHSISKEAFVAIGADFVSGWDGSISNQSTGNVNELIEKDITPFMAKSYDKDATIDSVYDDFKLLGKIFGVEEKAEQVIHSMKKDIKLVTDNMGNIDEEERVNVMVYDSGENEAMVVGSGLANNLIEIAGGNNVYGDAVKKPYINVSWENVVSKNPEVILVTDYMAGLPVENKIKFLKSHPALKDVEAIKNNNIYVVGLADLSPGIRNSKVIETMYSYFFEGVK